LTVNISKVNDFLTTSEKRWEVDRNGQSRLKCPEMDGSGWKWAEMDRYGQ